MVIENAQQHDRLAGIAGYDTTVAELCGIHVMAVWHGTGIISVKAG
jgi:hypothetical protein